MSAPQRAAAAPDGEPTPCAHRRMRTGAVSLVHDQPGLFFAAQVGTCLDCGYSYRRGTEPARLGEWVRIDAPRDAPRVQQVRHVGALPTRARRRPS